MDKIKIYKLGDNLLIVRGRIIHLSSYTYTAEDVDTTHIKITTLDKEQSLHVSHADVPTAHAAGLIEDLEQRKSTLDMIDYNFDYAS